MPGTPEPDNAEADGNEAEDAPAMWYDSDDEQLAVSLASQARLRKLRVTESEDLISGKEYIKRLRRLYQQLHPVPEWADPNHATKQKIKAGSTADDESDADGANQMDTDDEEDETMSVKPLARLLQGAADLTKIEDNARMGGKRKLRREVLGIQRLKDIGGDQPVSAEPLWRNFLGGKCIYAMEGRVLIMYTVFGRLAVFPSSPSTSLVIRASVHSFLTPHFSSSTCPQPASHIAPYPAHTNLYFGILGSIRK